MKIFKLMYLKKKGKLDERGAALANVLLISTFVMVLTSSIMSMAYSSYQMKQINLNSKNNFYSCEAVLDQIKVGFRNEMDALMSSQKTGETVTEEDVSAVCKKFYEEYQMDKAAYGGQNVNVSTDQALNSQGIYYYDLYKVSKLLTSIAGVGGEKLIFPEGATITQTTQNGYPVHSASVEMTAHVNADTDVQVTLQSDAVGTNNFELTDSYVVFHDLTVIYSEYGYESRITTDIKIEFPKNTSSSSTSSTSSIGWVDRLDDRVKTLKEWKTLFATDEWKQYSFGEEITIASEDNYVINTTDFPINTLRYVQFTADFFEEKDDWKSMLYLYPTMMVQAGLGDGAQYKVCEQGNYSNVYIYVDTEDTSYLDYDGSDMTDEELSKLGWVRFDKIFDTSARHDTRIYNESEGAQWCFQGYYFLTQNGCLTEDARRFVETYHVGVTANQEYSIYDQETGEIKTESLDKTGGDNAKIRYMVRLGDKQLNNQYSSRGWISISLGDRALSPDTDGIRVYVDIDADVYPPELYGQESEVIDWPLYENPDTGEKQNMWLCRQYFDFSECNYQVGDVIKVKLKNVNAAYTKDSIAAYYQTKKITGKGYRAEIKINSENIKVISDTEVEFSFEMTWDMFPYIYIQYGGALSQSSVAVETEWQGRNEQSAGEVNKTVSISKDALISYQNWRKE